MTDVRQGTTPLTEEDQRYLPNLEELQLGTKYAKRFVELPAFLYSQLTLIAQKYNFQIEQDGNGWAFIVDNGKRHAITVTVVNGKEVCSHEKGSLFMEQIKNDGNDALGTVGYGCQFYNKTSEELWPLTITSAYFTTLKSWEKNSSAYPKVMHYNLMVTLEHSPTCSVSVDEFKGQNNTAKLAAVLYDIERNQHYILK